MRLRFLAYGLATVALSCSIQLRAAPQQSPAAAASAAPTPRTPDGHPDLTGNWGEGGGGGSVTRDAKGDVDVAIPARGGSGANFEIDNAKRRRADPNKPLYKPEYVKKVQDLDDNEATEDPDFFCKPSGVPRVGAPNQIVQAPGKVVFLYQSGNIFRVIPTDGRAHSANLDETFMGDSVGHWEGDTLVVDVIGFNDVSWLAIPGYFHSTALHVTERLRREGNILHYQATVEDPEVLVQPWVMTPRNLKLGPDVTLWEDPPCEERDASHLVTKDHH
jgi:hypothetical protein